MLNISSFKGQSMLGSLGEAFYYTSNSCSCLVKIHHNQSKQNKTKNKYKITNKEKKTSLAFYGLFYHLFFNLLIKHRTTALNHFIHVTYDTIKIVCLPVQQAFNEEKKFLYRPCLANINLSYMVALLSSISFFNRHCHIKKFKHFLMQFFEKNTNFVV